MAGANGITSKTGGARVAGVTGFPRGTTWSQAANASRTKMASAAKGMTQFVEGRWRVPVKQKIRL